MLDMYNEIYLNIETDLIATNGCTLATSEMLTNIAKVLLSTMNQYDMGVFRLPKT
jgi:hypothetical protein